MKARVCPSGKLLCLWNATIGKDMKVMKDKPSSHVSCRAPRSNKLSFGREPWFSGHGRRLTFKGSWVRIPTPYTGWPRHFSHWFVVKIVQVCLKRPNINEKEAGVGPFFKKNYLSHSETLETWIFFKARLCQFDHKCPSIERNPACQKLFWMSSLTRKRFCLLLGVFEA